MFAEHNIVMKSGNILKCVTCFHSVSLKINLMIGSLHHQNYWVLTLSSIRDSKH
jgi:hypothetical protein